MSITRTAAGTPPHPQPGPAGDARHGSGRAFARRIECAGESARSTPARGGGMRDPEAWAQLRSARG